MSIGRNLRCRDTTSGAKGVAAVHLTGEHRTRVDDQPVGEGTIKQHGVNVTGDGAGHVQSLILSSILMGVGFQTILTAFLADLLAVNRRLMEDVQYRVKKLEYSGTADHHPGIRNSK